MSWPFSSPACTDHSLQSEYYKRGYQEGTIIGAPFITNCTDSAIVISPNMFHSKLWETSGHWQNYKDDMFVLDIEKEKWGLKPMNCPGHCLIFDSRDRSYKELPIRMAEFGILHRNEASGALTGLTRVRRFVQDDTHVFCMPSQVDSAIHLFAVLALMPYTDRGRTRRAVRLHAAHLRSLRL